MINDVSAYSIILVQECSYSKLGAYSINAGNQDRLVISAELEHAAEGAEIQDLRRKGGLGLFRDGFLYSVGYLNIDAGESVGLLTAGLQRAPLGALFPKLTCPLPFALEWDSHQ